MELIDTHSHIFLEEFNNDLPQVIQRAKNNGIKKIILPNIDLSSIESLHKVSEKYNQICFPALGLHPCSVDAEFTTNLEAIFNNFQANKYIAIGETGIDLYWDKTFFKQQIEAFKIQIDFAIENNLPVIIHARNSLKEIFEILDKYNNNNLRGVFHCFSGTYNEALKALSYNFYLGIGGVLTYKNSGMDKIFAKIDINKIILETDAPYLTPVPYRGKRNESAYIIHVAEKLSEIKNISLKEIAQITTSNAMKLFEFG